MSVVRHPIRGAVGTGMAVAVVAFTIQAVDPFAGTEVLGEQLRRAPQVSGSCDVDGVHVTYDASYRATPAPAGYRVVTVDLEQVSPTCSGATATAELLGGGSSLATAATTVVGSTATITFASPPRASDVDGVAVVLAGGVTPVPAACASMAFDHRIVLTGDADTYAASKDRDLVHAGAGADRIDGGNKADCLAGQAGDDALDGGNQDDVLLGDDGDDTLRGGAGDDVLIGGPGTDRCEGGPGRNTYDPSCEVVVR